jgi:hypothetical protein
MVVSRFLLYLGLIGCLFTAGCEDAEKKARYVKAPLETGDVTTRPTLNHAVNEARTRLLSVRNDDLRANLSREIDQDYARASASIREVERQQAAANERQAGLERAVAAAADEERRRKLAQATVAKSKRAVDRPARRRAAVADYRELTKDAVSGLQVGMRNSALGDGTKVLVLRNPTPYPASFDLRCHTRNDVSQKTFSIIIPAGGEKEIGFLQGWCGNFKRGERCEAYVDGERMWQYKVPTF